MKVPYSKSSLGVAQQIELLSSRGVAIPDKTSAVKFLTYCNYYYVSGYVYYFERIGPVRSHTHARPVSFDDIIHLVRFDQELREHFFSAVQMIEIAVRSAMARNLSLALGPFCVEKKELYKNQADQDAMLDIVRKAVLDHRNEVYIKHFSNKYSQEIPPIWVFIELLTFGNISRFYSNLVPEHQKLIANDFAVDHFILTSWLRAITELRNSCAHHARLWNKVFVNHPKIRNVDKGFPIIDNRVSRLGSFIPLIGHLLSITGEKPDWQRKCLEMLKTNSLIKPADLGLSAWWE